MKNFMGELKAASVFLPAILVVALVVTGVNSLKIPAYSDMGRGGSDVSVEKKVKKSLIGKKKTVSAKKSVSKGPADKLGNFKENGNYKDGTYTGSAQGFQSTITVSVKIVKGKISNVNVVSQGETPSYWSRAKAVVSRIKNSKSTNVDIVSGATYSSNGIINATRNALRKAEGKKTQNKPRKKPKNIIPKKPKPLPKPKSGGKVYPITNIKVKPDHSKQFAEYLLNTVNVHIKQGKIIGFSNIKWDSKNPIDVVCQNRVVGEMLPKVLKSNGYTKIDNVTGATCSANAMKEAIYKALAKAKKDGNIRKKGDKNNPEKPKKPKKPENKPKEDKKKPGKPKKPNKPDEKDKKPDNGNKKTDDKLEERTFDYTVESIKGKPMMVMPIGYDFGKYALLSIRFKIKNDRIIDMSDPVWEESPNNTWYQRNTFQQMREKLLNKGSLDGIAGATCTSRTIKDAAQEALILHSSRAGQ